MLEEDDQLYVYKLYGVSIPRKFKARKNLRNRIGEHTTITQTQIEKAEELIGNGMVDYSPYVFDCLEDILMTVQDVRNGGNDMDDLFYDRVIIPLVQIKGQAAMFGNPVASQLAHIVVNFMEHYHRLDNDVLKIIEACCHSIRISYTKDIKDLASSKAQLLISELQYAMKRYNHKFKQKTGR